MIHRKGMGKGKGKGFKNILNKDAMTHSMNAKGIKSRTTLMPISSKQMKKGLIKEIARKVLDGTKWAIKWESEHLPAQASWVKKEFAEAKVLAKKGKDNIQEFIEKKKMDLDDVRDEIDFDNDGEADITVDELEDKNNEIKLELQTIDLDDDGEADAQQEGFFDLANIEIDPVKIEVPKPPKDEDTRNPKNLSDAQLRKSAINTDRGFFGDNPFEDELIRRTKRKAQIKEHLAQERNKIAQSKKQKILREKERKKNVKEFGFIGNFI